jgi:hypothetical protein
MTIEIMSRISPSDIRSVHRSQRTPAILPTIPPTVNQTGTAFLLKPLDHSGNFTTNRPNLILSSPPHPILALRPPPIYQPYTP